MLQHKVPHLGLSLLISGVLGCGGSHRQESRTSLAEGELRSRTLTFAAETRLLGDTPELTAAPQGLFQPQQFKPKSFSAATVLYVPAQTATFLQKSFGETGFGYQSFAFVSSECNAGEAFKRYFAAIEALSGSTLQLEGRESIAKSFESIFASQAESGTQDICVLYELLSCFADFSRLNTDTLQQGAETGDLSGLFTGVLTCVSEVLGTPISLPESTTTEEDAG